MSPPGYSICRETHRKEAHNGNRLSEEKGFGKEAASLHRDRRSQGELASHDPCGWRRNFHSRLPSQYQALENLIERLPGCTVKVAYGAGPYGFWLRDRLTADGIEAIVVSPALIPVESGNKVKTDRRDSSKLAYLLKSGILKKVYVLSEEDRAVIGAIIILFVYGFIASRTRS